MPTKKILRKGKYIEVDTQIFTWRKRRKTFAFQKKRLFGILLDHFGDVERAKKYLRTPHPILAGAEPRRFISPGYIRKLTTFIKRDLGLSPEKPVDTIRNPAYRVPPDEG